MKKIRRLDKLFIKDAFAKGGKLEGTDGGAGSGNFGHKGRPGEVGGSGAGGESSGSKPKRLPISKDRIASITEMEWSEAGSRIYGDLRGKNLNSAIINEQIKAVLDKVDMSMPELWGFGPEFRAGDAVKGILEVAAENLNGWQMSFDDVEKAANDLGASDLLSLVDKQSVNMYIERINGQLKLEQNLEPSYEATGTTESLEEFKSRITLAKYEADRARQEAQEQEKPTATTDFVRDESRTEIDDVVHHMGGDGLPKVVGPEEFAKIESKYTLYRGVRAKIETTSEDAIKVLDGFDEQLQNGKWYLDCSGGYKFGHGMYTFDSTEKGSVTKYLSEGYMKKKFEVRCTEMKLDADCKVIDYGDIEDEYERSGIGYETYDPGIKAALLGYDAFVVTEEWEELESRDDMVVVLNRGKIIINSEPFDWRKLKRRGDR